MLVAGEEREQLRKALQHQGEDFVRLAARQQAREEAQLSVLNRILALQLASTLRDDTPGVTPRPLGNALPPLPDSLRKRGKVSRTARSDPEESQAEPPASGETGKAGEPIPDFAVLAVAIDRIYYKAPDNNVHVAGVGDRLYGLDGRFESLDPSTNTAVLNLNGRRVEIDANLKR